jgi:signal transduction histidine kinase
LRLKLIGLVVGTVSTVLLLVSLLLLPALTDSIRRSALDELAALAEGERPQFEKALSTGKPAPALSALVERTADRHTARITLLGIASSAIGSQTFVKADSAAKYGSELQYPAAVAAAASGRSQTAVEAGSDERIGEAAVPIGDVGARSTDLDAVLVVSRPLPPDALIAGWVRDRLLLAALIGIVLALTMGLLIARGITQRIRRLEEVAERVASGDLATQFPSTADDELGRLGGALEVMRSQLAELDSAHKRFIATASHELRTPLFSLGGFLELLEDEELSETDRRRFTSQLRGQVTRMQALATDLLDLSQIDAGSLELREEPVELRSLVRSVAAEFVPAVANHEAHLELRLPETELFARCDPDRLTQVLRILVANALTHTPRGTDIVLAAAQRETHVRLSVADHGPGISRAVLPTIFEPFATTDDMQGTGLGLAIARELSTLMRGELKVESRPGLTRFTLDLAPAEFAAGRDRIPR